MTMQGGQCLLPPSLLRSKNTWAHSRAFWKRTPLVVLHAQYHLLEKTLTPFSADILFSGPLAEPPAGSWQAPSPQGHPPDGPCTSLGPEGQTSIGSLQ